MYNALLDRLPEDYQGWLIRTDFRIGVQIQLCISDPEMSDGEKTGVALSLLYGNGVPPDLETAMEGLRWFLSCGAPAQEEAEDGGAEVYSFEYDAGRIVSAFRKVFGMDLSRERMHWFEFLPMLGDLRDTAFSSVMEIRETAVSEVDAKRRAEFARMKKRFALPSQYSAEDEEAVNSFLERFRKAGEEEQALKEWGGV